MLSSRLVLTFFWKNKLTKFFCLMNLNQSNNFYSTFLKLSQTNNLNMAMLILCENVLLPFYSYHVLWFMYSRITLLIIGRRLGQPNSKCLAECHLVSVTYIPCSWMSCC